MMDIEKVSPQQTHNLLITTFLPSQQVKYLSFIRLESPRTFIHNNRDVRFHSGLITATSNTLRLYSLALPNDPHVAAIPTALQIGNWRLHEDITGVVGWDRLIVVSTAQKIVGFKYEQGLLKNAFLISLEFLQLDPQDSCSIFTDKLGHYMLIYVRNYLLICFSEAATNKYKGRVQQKNRMENVSQECRWTETGRNHVVDMMKIKLVGLDINKIEQIQLLDEAFYFVGHRNKEKILFSGIISSFFNSNQAIPLIMPVKEQPQSQSQLLIHHSHQRGIVVQMLCHHLPTHILTFKSQHTSFQVGSFEGQLGFFAFGNTLFPLLLWQSDKGRLSLVQRVKTFQENYQFKVKQIATQCYGQRVVYRQGMAVLAGKSGVTLIGPTGEKVRIHQSLGSIIDLHVGKDMVVIENGQGKSTRVFELAKGPKVDQKPFNTHKKKSFLDGLSDLSAIYSFLLGQRRLEVLAVRRNSKDNKFITLYREGPQQFETLLQDIRYFHEATIQGQTILLVLTKTDNSLILTSGQQGLVMQPFQWSGWKMTKRWCQNDYFIGYDKQRNWVFYNILTKVESRAIVGKENSDEVNAFLQFRTTTYDRALKGHDVAEIYIICQRELQVWLIDLTSSDPNQPCQSSLIHLTHKLSEGAPILTNQLLFSDSHEKDAYRSLTCPEYNLNEHGAKTSQASDGVIISGWLYQGEKTLLVLVSSQDCILIYRKYFSVEDGGFIFRRVPTPLPIVKNFKWTGDKSFFQLGQGLVKFGNVLIYKGQLVESISARSLFRMDGSLWTLLSDGKIRLVHLGSQAYQGYCLRQVECGIAEELMGVDSTSQFYCVYSRKSFQIYTKDFSSQWRCQLGNQTVVCLKMFEHYVGMSYYDYYCDQEGVSDYNSVRFRFRIYNCATKNKIIERQKPLDEPILHIRFMAPDKLILVTSSLIFVNILKNDKTLELYRTHNFSSKRSFLSAFDYLPDKLSSGFGTQGSPGYMLFGGSHGGLGFFVGKWIQEEKLKEQWFQGFRCGIRQVSFFHFGEEKDELLKALLADEDGNLIVLTLKVDHAQKVADIRLGSPVNTFKIKSGSQRAVYCSMGDGSIRLLTAVKLDSEVSYLDFQKSFCQELPFYGGFNLRTSRRLTQKYRSGRLVSRGNVVDGDILQSFFSLTSTLRRFVLEDSDMELAPLKSILPF